MSFPSSTLDSSLLGAGADLWSPSEITDADGTIRLPVAGGKHLEAAVIGSHCVRKPVSIRELTVDERDPLKAGLRSPDTFTVRHCQILLASARGETAPAIAQFLGTAVPGNAIGRTVWGPWNWRNSFAPLSAVSIKHIYRFPKMCPDPALVTGQQRFISQRGRGLGFEGL
jgi:hypothetical protein